MNPIRVVLALMFAVVCASPAAAQAVPAGSMTLDEVIRTAQQRGSAARTAQLSLESTRYSYQAFTAGMRPQVSLVGTAADFNRGINPILTGDGETRYIAQSENQSSMQVRVSQQVPRTGGAFSLMTGLSRNDQFGDRGSQSWRSTPLIIGFDQPLFRPNGLKWQKQTEAVGMSIAERQYIESREDVAVTAVGAFFDVLAADISLRNALANIAVNATTDTINQLKYDRGTIDEGELLQSSYALMDARNSAERARTNKERAEGTLRRLLDLPATAPLSLVTPARLPIDSVDVALAEKAAVENGSAHEQWLIDDLQARRRVEDARLNSRFNANLSANVGFNQTATNFGGVYQSPLQRQAATVSVSMPIMQWGAGQAEIASSRSQLQRTEIATRARRDEITEQARFAAIGFHQAVRSLGLSARQDSIAARRFAVMRAQYNAGRTSLTDLLLAQAQKDAAQLNSLQDLRGYWSSYYQLRRVTLYDFVANKRIE